MADRKISDLTALTTPATGDLIPIVDVSEAAAADKNKSITVGELLRGAPDGTAAAPGIAFESDAGNGIFLAGTDQVGVATGGVERVEFGASEVVFNDGGANYDFRIEGDTNTALFFVDASTDRIGVNTTSPSEKLTVNGSIDLPTINTFIKGGGHNVLQVDATKTYFYGGTGGIQLRTADNVSELINITNAGLVGIGASSPAALLHLRSDTPYIRLEDVNDSQSWQIEARAFFGIYDVTDSAFRFAIDGSGNVGIGTNSPGTDPAVGNNATILEVRQTTSGSLTSGNSRKGAVLRLTHDAQWENPYSGGDDLGSIEFASTDTSTGEGVRARIRCTNNVYYQDQDLVFEVGETSSATINEKLRILNEGGITFNGDTAAANALDDYEEGNWTPTILSGVTSPGYGSQKGTYVRIGRLVTITCHFQITSGTDNSSHLKMQGLPFVSTTQDTGRAGIAFNFQNIGGGVHFYGHIPNNSSQVDFYHLNGGIWAGNTGQTVGKEMYFQGHYYVNT